MLKSQKHVFWQALLITLLIFGLGILLGMFIEQGRTEKISELYVQSEINLLDVQLQTEILNLKDINCGEAVRKNIEFGDKVFQDALILERYESASRLSDSLVQQHERYDLLRTLLWLNTIKIKEKCPNITINSIVYLYDYQSEDLTLKSKQAIFSRVLQEIKNKYSKTVILIPIARNLDISSLELLTKDYGINKTSIIVNENTIITELEDLEKIEQSLK